jgi:hypothetical protein
VALISGVAVTLGGLLIQEIIARSLLVALGGTLLTSSIFSIISESMVRIDIIEFIDSQFVAFKGDIGKMASLGHQASGVEVLDSRREFDFKGFLMQARGVVRIVGFSANDILSVANIDRIEEAVRSGRVTSIEILLQSPSSDAAARRGVTSAYTSPTSFANKFRSVLSEIDDLNSRLSRVALATLNYRLLDEAVTISIVADDRLVLATPVICNKTGGSSPSLVVRSSGEHGEIYNVYMKHFAELRSRAVLSAAGNQ